MLLGTFLIALIPRLLYVVQLKAPLYSDMIAYDQCATSLLAGEGLQESVRYKAYRPPGYPLFLALVYWAAGHSVNAALLLQAFLGAAIAPIAGIMTFLLVSGLSNPEDRKPDRALLVACLTATAVALSDEAIFYSGQLLSETLNLFVLMFWFAGVLIAKPGKYTLSANGVLNGILILIRPVALFMVPIGLWQAVRGERGSVALKNALRYCLFTFLIISPWAIRNAVKIGSFAVATNGGVNFYLGHNSNFGYMNIGEKKQIREQNQNLNEVQESALFYELGIKYILTNPIQDMKNNVRKIQYLYTTTWKPWPWSRPGRELRFAGGLWLPVWGWNWLAMLLILAGMFYSLKRRLRVDVLLWSIAAQTLSSVIYHADARFRLPLIPIFAFFLVQGILWGVDYTRMFPWNRWRPRRPPINSINDSL
jgi:hypothetical protein